MPMHVEGTISAAKEINVIRLVKYPPGMPPNWNEFNPKDGVTNFSKRLFFRGKLPLALSLVLHGDTVQVQCCDTVPTIGYAVLTSTLRISHPVAEKCL